jgi:hypothetical protein
MVFGFIPLEVWDNLLLAGRYLYIAMPIWLPVAFLVVLFNALVYYKRTQFWQKEGSVLLEIKLPREITKSPLAMEVVLGAFHQTGSEGTWVNRIWKGQTRSWFSLEMVSVGGNVRFFIWTRPKHRNLIESSIYSQYPGIEIYEVEDYTKPFYYDPDKNEVFATEFILTRPDPYPIKTYVDYGLDADPKEEFKIDPMTPVIEFLGSITAGHNIWYQIIIRAHKKKRLADVFGEREDSWEDESKEEIKKIIEKLKTAKEEGGLLRRPTKGETDIIAALERSISKFSFDCGIRAIYVADKDKYNPANIGGIVGCLKQYGSLNLNGIKPNGWLWDFEYPWQEWRLPWSTSWGRKEELKKKVLEEYKLRRFFYSPGKGRKFHSNKPFILNTEELATIYHFPGAVAGTPTFEKIPSLKSKAPPNLPI